MNKMISSTNAKNNFGSLIDEVSSKGNSYTIFRNNKPVAKVVPIINYENEKLPKPLRLNDSEYKKMKKAVKEFRNSFKITSP